LGLKRKNARKTGMSGNSHTIHLTIFALHSNKPPQLVNEITVKNNFFVHLKVVLGSQKFNHLDAPLEFNDLPRMDAHFIEMVVITITWAHNNEST